MTRGASQRPVTYDDDDRQRDILRARPARTGACNRLLLPREGVLDFCSRCTFSRGESRGHVDSSSRVRLSVRRWCDGRWECLVKPANCYRFIGVNTCTRVRKKGGSHVEDHPFTADVRPREIERERPDLRLRKFVVSLCHFVVHACTNVTCVLTNSCV